MKSTFCFYSFFSSLTWEYPAAHLHARTHNPHLINSYAETTNITRHHTHYLISSSKSTINSTVLHHFSPNITVC
ncbi:hypothetical protein Hanom_Chr10g00939661 [Helianthus anomalus]